MFTYAYRCTHLDWKYEKEKNKSINEATFCRGPLCTFEALYLTKVLKRKKKMRTMFPDITELSTFAYRK